MNKPVLLITGGSDGVGRAVAQAAAAEYTVVVLARNAPELERVAAEVGGNFVVADVTDAQAVQAAVKQVHAWYGQIDVVVHCAGMLVEGKLDEIQPEEIEQLLAVNTLGTMYVTRAVLPRMRQQQRGKIICLGSQAALSAHKYRSIYNASKWAIRGFCFSLQQEVLEDGISVTAVHPGLLKTNLLSKAGITVDQSRALGVSEVVRVVECVLQTPFGVVIPEVGVQTLSDCQPF